MNCVLLSGYYICYIGVITAGLAVMAVTNVDSEWEINAFAIFIHVYKIIQGCLTHLTISQIYVN